MTAFVACAPFDRNLYLARYPDFSDLELSGRLSLHSHWLKHGYFEGRPLYGWESLPFDLDRELLSAPPRYFDMLQQALLAEFDGAYERAEAGYLAAISAHSYNIAARIGLARLYMSMKRLLDCQRTLDGAASLDPACVAAHRYPWTYLWPSNSQSVQFV